MLEINAAREWTNFASPPVVTGYGWAPYEVGLYAPYYITSTSLEYYASTVNIVSSASDADSILLTVCRLNERACHGREGHSTDFFYVYSTLFRDLGVHLPFTDFQSSMLRDFNVAPTQLHPNGWGYMQAFVVVCTALALAPSSTTFLYFFHAILQAKKSWISLSPMKGKQLFTLFNSSNKNFKTEIFKVVIREKGRSIFYLEDGLPKFPFYWTEHPKKFVSRSKSSMTPEELEIVSPIDQLPRKTSSRALFGLLG